MILNCYLKLSKKSDYLQLAILRCNFSRGFLEVTFRNWYIDATTTRRNILALFFTILAWTFQPRPVFFRACQLFPLFYSKIRWSLIFYRGIYRNQIVYIYYVTENDYIACNCKTKNDPAMIKHIIVTHDFNQAVWY